MDSRPFPGTRAGAAGSRGPRFRRALTLLAAGSGLWLPTGLRADVLQADNFNDNSLNGSLWRTVSRSSSSGAEENQAFRTTNRHYLVTQGQWDPTSPTYRGQHLAGTWKWNQGTSGSPENLQILTRSTGAMTGTYGETSGGIEFYARNSTDPTPHIQSASGNGGQFSFSSFATAGTVAIDIGDTFAYDIWDFGDGKLSFLLTEISGSQVGRSSVASAVLSSNLTTSTNYVTCHGRERSNNTDHGSIIDNVVISAPSSWTGAESSSWTTGVNWAGGGSGGSTNPNGNGIAVVFGKPGASDIVDLDGVVSVGAIAFYPDVSTTLYSSTSNSLVLNNEAALGDGGSGWSGITVFGGTHALNTNLTMASSVACGVINRDDTLIVGGDIDGAGKSLVKGGAGTLLLSGMNSYGGNTYVSTGTLEISGTASLPGWDTNGRYSVAADATLAVTNSVSDGEIGTMTVTTNFASGSILGFDTSNGDRSFDNALANSPNGTLGLCKLGANTLFMNGASTYTGTTNVTAGSLQIDGSLNGTPAINVSGHLQVNGLIAGGGTVTVNGTAQVTGVISGGRAVEVPAGGVLDIIAGGTIAGRVTVSGGSLDLAGWVTSESTSAYGLSLLTGTVSTTGPDATVNRADFSSGTGVMIADAFPLQVTYQARFPDNVAITLGEAYSFSLGGADVVHPTSGDHRVITATGGVLTITGGSDLPASGLRGLWKFDSGNLLESTGLAYTQTSLSAPAYSPDTHNGCGRSLSLTSGNCVLVGDGTAGQTIFDGGGAMTVSLWFKGNTSGPTLASKYGENGQGWQMRGTSTVPQWTTRGGSGHGDMNANTVTTLNNGAWHMLTMSYDGTNKHIYVDGVLNKSTPATGLIAAAPGTKFVIGGRQMGSNGGLEAQFTGLLDDVRFFDRGLTVDEVLRLYNDPFTGNLDLTTTDLVVNSSTELVLGPGVTRFGNLSLNGVATFLTLGGSEATVVSFDNVTASDDTWISGWYPVTLGAGMVSVADTKTLTLDVGLADGPAPLGLTKSGLGALVLNGINTCTGDTVVSAGSLLLNENAGMTFVIADSSNNKVTGAGTVVINGDFTIDTSAVTVTSGSWVLVNAAHKSFGPTFGITGGGWSRASGVWTKPDGAKTWTFTENAGTLALSTSAQGYGPWAAAKGLNPSNNGTTQNPDNDARTNLDEFALDGNPLSGASDGKVVCKIATVGGSTKVLTLTLPVRVGANFSNSGGELVSAPVDGVVYHVCGSGDLASFTMGVSEVSDPDAAAIRDGMPALSDINLDSVPDWTYRTFKLDASAGLPGKGFLGVKITE